MGSSITLGWFKRYACIVAIFRLSYLCLKQVLRIHPANDYRVRVGITYKQEQDLVRECVNTAINSQGGILSSDTHTMGHGHPRRLSISRPQMKSDPLLSFLFFEGFLLSVLRDPIQPSCYE